MQLNKCIKTINLLSAFWFSALFAVASASADIHSAPPQTEPNPAADKKNLANTPALSKEVLGNIVFNDASLSHPPGQSCASCHKPDKAFADPGMASSEGAVKGIFGSRNTPSLTYVSFTPVFQALDYEPGWVGGLFWDGRANTLQEQALGPLLNPIEMNNSLAGLAKKLRSASYYSALKQLYGEQLASDDQAIADAAADVLAAFQKSEQLQPFTSKYDYYEFNLIELSEQELRGIEIFNDKGMCTDCHSGLFHSYELFSSYRHHNILIPANPELEFYRNPKELNPLGSKFIDIGLAANPQFKGEAKKSVRGLFRTPTMRNVAMTPPYMHNGVFKTLEEVVDYYNDINSMGAPELEENPSVLLSSPLNLTTADKAALVAFLKTLTDGYQAPEKTFKELRKKQALRFEEYQKQNAYKSAATLTE